MFMTVEHGMTNRKEMRCFIELKQKDADRVLSEVVDARKRLAGLEQ